MATRLYESSFDISSFINEILEYAQLAGKNSEDIRHDLYYKLPTEIGRDKELKRMLNAEILKRLKYSTGSLINSLAINASVDLDSKSRTVKPVIDKGKRHWVAQYNTSMKIAVDLTTKDKTLINALLSEPELSGKVPSIAKLTEWIRGKDRYFEESIEDIHERRVLKALRLQRNKLERQTSTGGIVKTATRMVQEDKTPPIEVIAKTIRSRMRGRVKAGLPPTKGSEYIFLGLYESGLTKKRGHPQEFLMPKYRVESRPLYTINPNITPEGILNQIIRRVLSAYIKKVLKLVAKKFKEGGGIASDYKSISYKIGLMRALGWSDEGIKKANYLIDSLRGNLSTPKRQKYHDEVSMYLNNLESKQVRIIMDYARSDSLALKRTIISAVKHLNSMKVYYIKRRRAKRRKRKARRIS